MRHRVITGFVAALGLALASAPAAMANTSNSANWAGYAVHRANVDFRQISGSWRVPSAACVAGQPRYSAAWVGIGGYSESSTALEQIGTEVDCNNAGKVVPSAWYELVPAPAHTIRFKVRPGDLIRASVRVNGLTVVMTLDDVSRHHHFTKTIRASAVDVSSAEWIVEAPSDCIDATSCETLPLAEFSTMRFTAAHAVSSAGHLGSISDRSWMSTQIDLVPGGPGFISSQGPGNMSGGARASALSAGGTAFTVNYVNLPVSSTPSFARRRPLHAGYIEHLGP
jgi:hypothetical protein